MNTHYAAIILAGGLSTRMKQFKPLLPLGQATVTDHVVATFLSAGTDVFLVAGYRHDDIKAGIKKRDITVVYNPDYEQGMFSSIQAGIKYLQSIYQAFFINPVDIPLVRPETVKQLMAVSTEHPGKIIYPVFKGKRGHPPLIPYKLAPIILGWGKEGGLKAVLDSQEKLAFDVTVPDSNILFDIDTPADYAALLKRYQHYEIPTDEECNVILKEISNNDHYRIKHNYKVAEVAVAIGKVLESAGHKVDIELIRVAAILHDIAKGQKKHDVAGGNILRELGFGKVGDIVAVHSDLAGGDLSLSLDAKVVYLADKFVLGEKLVSLEERYSSANRRFGLTPEIETAIKQRLEVAQQVKKELESLISRNLESVISRIT